jgi:siroheme synthase-like protein
MPINMDITGRKVLVVGAGNVALRKIRTLIKYGAKVTVMAEEIREHEISAMACRGLIDIIDSRAGTLPPKVFFLTVAATDDEDANERMSKILIDRGFLVDNVSGKGNIVFPAVYEEGDLTVAVSTSGVSPALAVKLRNIISALFGGKYAPVILLIKEYRELAKKQIKDKARRSIFLKELSVIFSDTDTDNGNLKKMADELLVEMSVDP